MIGFLLVFSVASFSLCVNSQAHHQNLSNEPPRQNSPEVRAFKPTDSQGSPLNGQNNVVPQRSLPPHVQRSTIPVQKTHGAPVHQAAGQSIVQEKQFVVPSQEKQRVEPPLGTVDQSRDEKPKLNAAPGHQLNAGPKKQNFVPQQQHQPNQMSQQIHKAPPIQQAPIQPNGVTQQTSDIPAQEVAQQQPYLMQEPNPAPQQLDAPPNQNTAVNPPNIHHQPNVPLQQMPPQAPPVQQPPSVQYLQSQPVANLQAPILESPPKPPHLHSKPTPMDYEHFLHDSLPPKSRQIKFEPPAILHQDSELDYYSRLPSPQNLDSNINSVVDTIKPSLSLTVNVTPAVKDCYFYEAATEFDVDVQVLGGEGMDIGLAVFDPSGAPVVTRDPVGEASVTITVLPQYRGRSYAICLDNRKATYGRKKVFLGIDLRINWENPNSDEQDLIDQMKRNLLDRKTSTEMRKIFQNFDRLSDSLDRISGLLHRTKRLQQRSRNNAAVDRTMMQANKDRVTSWSTFQAVLLIFVGIVQTRLIRSLFDEQSSFYRLWVLGGRQSGSTKYHFSGLRY